MMSRPIAMSFLRAMAAGIAAMGILATPAMGQAGDTLTVEGRYLLQRSPTDAAPSAAVSAGNTSTFNVGVVFDAAGPATTPVEATITLPPGVTVTRAEADIPADPDATVRWVCAQEATVVSCSLLDTASGGHYPLPPNQAVNLSLLTVGDPAVIPAGPPSGEGVAVGDATVAVTVVHQGVRLAKTITVPVDAVTGPRPPRPVLEVVGGAVTNRVDGSTRRAVTYRVRNVGGTAARSRGSTPAITLSSGTPPPTRTTGLRVSGKGWACTVKPGGECRYRGTIAPGRLTPPLTVSWKAAPDAGAVDLKWPVTGEVSYVAPQSLVPAAPPGSAPEESPDAGIIPFSQVVRLVIPETLARLVVQPLASSSTTAMLPGRRSPPVRTRVLNSGPSMAPKVAARVVVPKGMSIQAAGGGWTCTGTSPKFRCERKAPLASGATTNFNFTVAAPEGQPVRRGRVIITPLGVKGAPRGSAVSLPLVVLDPGDPLATPQLWLRSGKSWTHWRSGAVTRVPARDEFRYRIALVNRGGDVIGAGTPVTLRQAIGGGIEVLRITPSPGLTCGATAPLSCTFTGSQAVNPGATFARVEVAVRPTRIATEAALGQVVTSVKGVPGTERLPMRVQVVDNPHSLEPAMKVALIPTAGGRGTVAMTVTNQGPGLVQGVRASTTLPQGISLTRATGAGWACDRSGRRLDCSYAPGITAGRRTSGLLLSITSSVRPATRLSLAWSASGIRVADGRRQVGSRSGPLPVRGPISVHAEVTPKVLSASTARSATRDVVLNGTASTGNGVAIDYHWRQRCLTAEDAGRVGACKGRTSPRARIAHPNIGSTKAIIPKVKARTVFVFELAITDGSAVRTRTLAVTAMPAGSGANQAGSANGGHPTAAQAKADLARQIASQARSRASRAAASATSRRKAASSWATAARTANASAPQVTITGAPLIEADKGAEVALSAVTRGSWHGTPTIEWTQVSGPEVKPSNHRARDTRIRAPDGRTLLTYRVTARDSRGATSTAQVVVAVGAAPTAGFTSLSKRARTDATGTPTRISSNITASFGRVTTKGSNASSSSGFSFSGTTVTIGALSVTGASGTTSPAAMVISRGSLVLPAEWRLGPITINPDAPLVLTFGGANGTDITVSGQVTAAQTFGLLRLPTGWSGRTTLTFAPGAGTISASAVGNGTGAVSLSGSFSTDGSVDTTVSAKNLLIIGGTSIDVTGTATRGTSGPVATSITGGIGSPVALEPGLALTALTATWTPSAPDGAALTGNGSIAISSGSSTPLSINVGLSYTSSTAWTMTVTGSGGPTWNPLPGLSLNASDFAGSIGQKNATWQWDLTASIPSWRVSDAVLLRNIGIELSNQCTSTSPACPGGDLFLKLTTGAVIDPPVGASTTGQGTAVIGLGEGGGFSLAAAMGDVGLAPGVSLAKPTLNATFGMPATAIPASVGAPVFSTPADTDFAILVSAGLSVPGLGNFSAITANINSKGWAVGGYDADGIALGSSNGKQSDAYFGWSSYATTMTADIPGFGTKTLDITAGEFSVAGGYQVPDWFSKFTKTGPIEVLGTIQFQPSTGYFDATIAIPGSFNLPVGGSKADAASMSFEIQNNAEGLTVMANASVALAVKASGGGMQQAPTLTASIGYDITTTTVEASLEFVDDAGWQNAFGVDGLVVKDASFTLMWNAATETPGLKLLASGDLPNSIAGPFKVPGSGIPVVVGAELSDTNPCIDVQVGDSTGTTPVLSVGGGAMTANYFEFIVAPDGCQLSPQSAPIAPGFQMAFDGSVLGTTVDVTAALSLEPTVFRASVDIGAFGLGGLQFKETKIAVLMDEGQGLDSVSFAGGFSMFGTSLDVSGSLAQAGSTTSASLKVAEAGTFDVAGFRLTNMMVQADVTFGPGIDSVAVSASGQMDLLGVDVDVKEFDVSIQNGVVEEVAFDIVTSVKFAGALTADGEFNMKYTESSGEFDLSAAVVLSTPTGFSIGTKEKPATLDISPQCVAFEGDLALDPVFTATLAGTIVYKDGCLQQVRNPAGQMVSGNPGDFSFDADNVGLDIAGFDATGTVAVGQVAGDDYAQVQTTLKLGPQSGKDEVDIAGEFQSNGDFSLTGKATLALAGIDLDTSVAASKSGADVAVTGQADLSIGGTVADISGAFSMDGGAPSTTLTGSLQALNLGGFDLGSAAITLSQTPSSVGVSAAIEMSLGTANAGATAKGDVSLMMSGNGAVPLFHGTLDGTLNIPALGSGVSMAATFTDCNEPCTAAAAPSFTLDGKIQAAGFTFAPSITMAADGSFAANVDSGGQVCTGTAYLVVVEAQGCFGYSVTMFLGSSAPYYSLGASANADVDVRYWEKQGKWWQVWKWGWSGWSTFGVNIGASVQLDPFKVCVDVLGHDLCA